MQGRFPFFIEISRILLYKLKPVCISPSISIDVILLLCLHWNTRLSQPSTQFIITLPTRHSAEKTWKYFSYFSPFLLSSLHHQLWKTLHTQHQRKPATVPCSWETSPWGHPTDMWRTRPTWQEDWRRWTVAPGLSTARQVAEVTRPVLMPVTARWASATLGSHVSDRSADGRQHVPGEQNEVYPNRPVEMVWFGFITNVFVPYFHTSTWDGVQMVWFSVVFIKNVFIP